MGARFTKWRAAIRIGQGLPSRHCIQTNAHALGRYASLAQEAGLVPIVEPEVLMDGDHVIQRSQDVTEEVLVAVFEELSTQRCMLEGIILKPNMVTAGSDYGTQANANEVAERTLQTLLVFASREAVPGIAFLSGGQSGGKQRARTLMPWPQVGLCHGNSASRSGARFSIRRSKYGLGEAASVPAGATGLSAPSGDEQPRESWQVLRARRAGAGLTESLRLRQAWCRLVGPRG